MVSFAKIEHATRRKKQQRQNNRALLSFAIPQLDGPRKSSTLPPFFSNPMQKILCVISFLFKKPSRKKVIRKTRKKRKKAKSHVSGDKTKSTSLLLGFNGGELIECRTQGSSPRVGRGAEARLHARSRELYSVGRRLLITQS
jgi:hypothetical protein